jgi:hypothetical protein
LFKDGFITAENLRRRIGEYCALYVDENLKPLLSPTLAVIDGDYSFRPLTDSQLRDLRRYSLALLLCSVGAEQEHAVCVSDQFMFLTQNFTLTEDAIAYTTGSLYRVTNWRSIPTTRLVRPAYVPGEVILYRYEEKLMEGLANLIDLHDAADDRIFEVLAWVRYAFLNADANSYESL